MRPSNRKRIRTLPLFRDVKAQNFEHLVGAGFLQRFPSRVTLIHEGDLPDFLHIVVEGTVELFSTDANRETTLDIIQPVATFILAAVIRDEPYLKSGRTLTPAQVLMIPAPAVRDVFGRDAAFARAVVDELAIRYRSIVRTLKNQKLRTGTERLANWILRADLNNGAAGRYTLPHDKRTLASLLGMTPENLSRNLAELKIYGVSSSGRDVIVEDRAALEKFARPNPLIDG